MTKERALLKFTEGMNNYERAELPAKTARDRSWIDLCELKMKKKTMNRKQNNNNI